jgi:hypothetical protein
MWLPNLGCDEQQKLLGVESAEAVVETAKDVVLVVAAVLGMRASWYLMPRRRPSAAGETEELRRLATESDSVIPSYPPWQMAPLGGEPASHRVRYAASPLPNGFSRAVQFYW